MVLSLTLSLSNALQVLDLQHQVHDMTAFPGGMKGLGDTMGTMVVLFKERARSMDQSLGQVCLRTT
jgi:hypothetical protein